MYEIGSKIDEANIEELEAYFYEEGKINWAIIEEKEGGGYELKGFFDDEGQALVAWNELSDHFGFIEKKQGAAVELEDSHWQNRYKEFVKPWKYDQLAWVPSWLKEEYKPQDETVLWLDAGMAFGTGAHETTQLCGQRIVDYCNKYTSDELNSKYLIDAGCGSGILGLSAYLLSIDTVCAFDIDPDAIEVCEVNAINNDLKDKVKFQIGGLEDGLSGNKADIVVANILAHILSENALTIVNSVKSDGVLILSGILNEEMESVRNTYLEVIASHNRKCEVSSNSLGDWSDLQFVFID